MRKYRLPDSRNSPSSGFYWLLVILALAALAWIWWHAGKTSEHAKAPAKKPTAKQTTNGPHTVTAAPRTNAPPPTSVSPAPSNDSFPRPVQNIFEAQLALERSGISSGSLDGRIGSQTRAAIRAFQQRERIPRTGELDAATKAQLSLGSAPLAHYVVTSNDLARLQPLGKTWLAKSQQTALDYETLLELVAEKSHAHPVLIRQLNPSVNWTNAVAGTVLQIPNAERDDPPAKAAFVKISLSGKMLEAFGADTNLLAHFSMQHRTARGETARR
jgi:peptidoglycan hydrolase-like protein with peptidoglycan-binding domain